MRSFLYSDSSCGLNGRSRKSVPAPGAARNVSYPEVQEGGLDNGLRVLLIRDDRLPIVSVRLALPVGRVDNPQENWSLMQLAVELTREGTESRSSVEIANEMDQLAIYAESEVLMEYTLLALGVLEEHLEKALDLFSDTVLRPTFPQKEVEKLKVRWRNALVAQRSQPGFLANERTFETLYPSHPYSRVSIPLRHLERSDSDLIGALYRRSFVPAGALLIFAGPIGLERATELAERYFDAWTGRSLPEKVSRLPEAPSARLVRLVHRPHSVQSRIVVSGRIPARPDPRLIPFRLANQVFGGGASSRLFLNLREKRSYTYGAYSAIRSYRYDGLFMASADVRTEVTLDAITETLNEIGAMRKSSPGDDEIPRSRAEIIGAFIRQMETSSSVASLELSRRMNGQPDDYYQNFMPAINGITGSQVLEISRRFFDPENVVITVVGDRGKVEGSLQSLGELEVYDPEGNRLSS